MIKGDQIRLVKPMGAFTNVGEICEVIDVTNGGVISFKFGNCYLGCMSYDEYLKYFELVKASCGNRKWTKWEESSVIIRDIYGKEVKLNIKYRNNGKKIQIKTYWYDFSKSKVLMAESSCHSMDKFNFEKGFRLAKNRLLIKWLICQVDDIAKNM